MITDREFQVKTVKGYKWFCEYTADIEGRWMGKAFLGGMLRYKTAKMGSIQETQFDLSVFIFSNPYFK